jgi:hypothetical protein
MWETCWRVVPARAACISLPAQALACAALQAPSI